MGEKIFQVCLAKTNDAGEALYTELDLPARPWALLDALDKVRHQPTMTARSWNPICPQIRSA